MVRTNRMMGIQSLSGQKINYWCAPQIWKGSTCYVVGGGPSVADIDIERLRGRHIIAINNAFKLAPWIDVMFFGDYRWYFQHKEKLLEFAGLKVTSCDRHADKPAIKIMKRKNMAGISPDSHCLAWNFSSGACALNLAFHFGVRRIVLIGFDMKKSEDGRCNYHNEHPPRLSQNYDPYNRFRQPFVEIAKALVNHQIDCVNATPGSALDVFRKVDLKDTLNRTEDEGSDDHRGLCLQNG